VCHSPHENDSVYTENIADYCAGVGIDCRSVEIGNDTSALLDALEGRPTSVIGFNSQLDHAFVGNRPFLSVASSREVPIVQWILDHPSGCWPAFHHSTVTSSRYVFNSPYSEGYFRRYCLPNSITSSVTGVGPNKRSRIAALDIGGFLDREYSCLIPLNLARIMGPIDRVQSQIDALEAKHRAAVLDAFMLARYDLVSPIEVHVASVLNALSICISIGEFHRYVHIVEEKVQAFRRLYVFEVAKNYPVMIQSDNSAWVYADGGVAYFSENIGMKETLSRMPRARAIVSVSHLNDMIHDRTLNGLNAGCVNVVEDSIAHRAYFQSGANALFFRYDDDSLHDCLALVCSKPRDVYPIAENGYVLRDEHPFRFGGYHNLVKPRDRVQYLPNKTTLTKSEIPSRREVIKVTKFVQSSPISAVERLK
jgi:hypothetical protein